MFALAPAALAALMTDSAEVIEQAKPLIVIAAVFQLSDGVQGVGAGVLRGAGDTRFTFLANLVGHYLVGLPLALFLAYSAVRGVVGLWWGLSAGLTVVAITLFLRFQRLASRPIQPLAPQS